jgi:hypothetical protein
MTSFFYRFCKALPVIGLSFLTMGAVAAAEVAVLTYHDPDCTEFVLRRDGNSGPATLVCIKGDDNGDRPSCSVTLSTPAFLGKEGGIASLSGSCSNATGANYSWMRTASDTGNTVTYTGSSSLTNNQVPENNGDEEVVYTYTFYACKGVGGENCSYPVSKTVTVLTTIEVPVIDPPTDCTASASTGSVSNDGGSVTLNGSCASSSVSPSTMYSWARSPSGGGFPKTGTSVSDAFGQNAGSAVTYNYTMTACNADKCASSNQVTVTHQGTVQQTPPTGCTVTPTAAASLSSTGGQVSWTASCSGNATSATYSWTRTGGSGGTQNYTGTLVSENLSANSGTSAITYTYTMKACNGTACATDITRTATVAAAGGGTDQCGQHTNVTRRDLAWGDSLTIGVGSGVLAAKIVVPAGVKTGYSRISISEHQSSAATRNVAISQNACDFNDRSLIAPQFDSYYMEFFATGTATGYPKLEAGRTYYLNVRNQNAAGNNTCGSGTCSMLIQFVVP